jgi:hypothetical protein
VSPILLQPGGDVFVAEAPVWDADCPTRQGRDHLKIGITLDALRLAAARNRMLKEFPQIHGWADHWTWIAADPNVDGSPIDWETRYEERLWIAGQSRA